MMNTADVVAEAVQAVKKATERVRFPLRPYPIDPRPRRPVGALSIAEREAVLYARRHANDPVQEAFDL